MYRHHEQNIRNDNVPFIMFYQWSEHTVDGSEILLHLGCIKPFLKNGQFQLATSAGGCRISEPPAVSN